MPSAPLLDREFLEKLERLTIQWQKSFPGLVGGHNRSRFSGPGLEFLDHRNFHHGDDLRAVNWRAYMRLEKLFLKMFQVEPRVPIRLLLDTSASMSSDGGTKFDFARKLTAALCYVGLVRLDTIEVHPYSDKLALRFFSSGGRHRFGPVADRLNGLETGGHTETFAAIREFMSVCPQRGLVIMISDFLDDRGCERPLQYLADYGHELLLVQVWSEEDRTPPWLGELELQDAESGKHLKLQFDEEAQRRYTRAFDAYADNIRRLALRSGGRYVGISTAQPVEEVIFGPLMRARGTA